VLKLRRDIVPSLNFNGPHPVNMYHRTIRYDDLTAAEQLVQGEEEKERIRYIVNRLAQQTMRGSVSAHWWLPLDSISYTGLDAALGDEAEKLYVSAFPYGVPHPKGANYLTVELAVLKEMTRELADLFGLMLPIPLEGQAHKTAGHRLAAEPHVTTHPRELVGTSS
jgi:hypothetical protein